MQPLLSFVKPTQKLKSAIALRTRQSDLSWWIAINASVPLCTYYFGSFENQTEARDSSTGYVDNLFEEGARNIGSLKHCQPKKLATDLRLLFHSILR
jgi:hypothetical protein